MTGLSPFDLMKKAQVTTECEVCGEELTTFADSTDDVGSQLADVLVVHLIDEHIDGVPVEFSPEDEQGIALQLLRTRDVLVEDGVVRRSGQRFVVRPRGDDDAQ